MMVGRFDKIRMPVGEKHRRTVEAVVGRVFKGDDAFGIAVGLEVVADVNREGEIEQGDIPPFSSQARLF